MNYRIVLGGLLVATIAGVAYYCNRKGPVDSPEEYVKKKWNELEEKEQYLTDAVPALHAELDQYIRDLVDITDEAREELHAYNARKLTLNSPV